MKAVLKKEWPPPSGLWIRKMSSLNLVSYPTRLSSSWLWWPRIQGGRLEKRILLFFAHPQKKSYWKSGHFFTFHIMERSEPLFASISPGVEKKFPQEMAWNSENIRHITVLAPCPFPPLKMGSGGEVKKNFTQKNFLGEWSEVARKLVKSYFWDPVTPSPPERRAGPNIQMSDFPLLTWYEHSCTSV